MTRGFLWTVLPFLPVPETRTIIPWAEIEAIEPVRGLETAVVIQKRGDRKRWWERFGVSATRPAGRVLNLSLFNCEPADLQRSLLAWSEERLRLEVHRARADESGGDAAGRPSLES